jgi:hypothetical protein
MRKAAKNALALGLFAALLAMPALAQADVTLTNGPPLAIPDGYAPASPYPSTITTPALMGTLTGVQARVSSLNFSNGDDLGILLQGPGGQALPLLQGGPGLILASLTFDDAAPGYVPVGEAITQSRLFKPTDYYPDDDYPAGGPSHLQYSLSPPAGAATLASTFSGTDPSGAWKLWVADFASGPHTGQASGWSLTLRGVQVDNRFTLGTPQLALRGFSANVPATFPNPGVVSVKDAAVPLAARAHKGKRKKKRLKPPALRVAPTSLTVTGGTTLVPITLTAQAIRFLARRGHLFIQATISYRPSTTIRGTQASAQAVGIILRTASRHRRKHQR